MDASPKPSERFVYPIIDTRVCREHRRSPIDVAEACLRGGARWLQVRSKGDSSAAFLAIAEAIVAAAREYDARVIVNDRADIARLSGARGVHVGQDDLPVEAVRRIIGATAIVGLSTHDLAQVDAALASMADYVAVGPIYGTSTKDTGYSPRGLDLVRGASGRGKPIVAIGGITLANVLHVVEAGASGVAVIADILRGDPEVRMREFLQLLE